MKAINFINILALTILASCSGVELTSEYDKLADFSSYKTFSVCMDITVENPGQPAYDNLKNRLLIADAIVAEMKDYYVVNDSAPDLRVGFHIVLDKKKFEYRNCSRSTYYNSQLECSFETIEYTLGTLIVYAADVANNQVIWQASANGVVDTVKSNQKIIEKTVQKLFSKFPLHTQKSTK